MDMTNEILLIGEIHPKIEDEYKIFEIFYETFESHKNLFREESESLKRCVEAVPIVCGTELELITRFKPQTVFMEVGIGRSDIKDIADRINAVYFEFKYESGNYESTLIEQLIKIAHLASRMAAVIGNTHLKPVKRTLGEAGFNVNCVTIGGMVDKKEKRRIGRAFRIIRKMLDTKDLSYSR